MATKFTYYSAATDLSPNKTGHNRIMWEDFDRPSPTDYFNEKVSTRDNAEMPQEWGWKEITREYFPQDLSTELSDEQLIAAFSRLKELGVIK